MQFPFTRDTPPPPLGNAVGKRRRRKREKVSRGNSIWDEIKPRFRVRERQDGDDYPSVRDGGRNRIALRLVKKCMHKCHRGGQELLATNEG